MNEPSRLRGQQPTARQTAQADTTPQDMIWAMDQRRGWVRAMKAEVSRSLLLVGCFWAASYSGNAATVPKPDLVLMDFCFTLNRVQNTLRSLGWT